MTAISRQKIRKDKRRSIHVKRRQGNRNNTGRTPGSGAASQLRGTRKEGRCLSCPVEDGTSERAQDHDCFCGIPEGFLHREYAHQPFRDRRSKGHHPGVGPRLRSVCHGGCVQLQPYLFALRDDEPHVPGRSFPGFEENHRGSGRKSQKDQCDHAVPVREPSA
jgi:hypothetical protein